MGSFYVDISSRHLSRKAQTDCIVIPQADFHQSPPANSLKGGHSFPCISFTCEIKQSFGGPQSLRGKPHGWDRRLMCLTWLTPSQESDFHMKSGNLIWKQTSYQVHRENWTAGGAHTSPWIGSWGASWRTPGSRGNFQLHLEFPPLTKPHRTLRIPFLHCNFSLKNPEQNWHTMNVLLFTKVTLLSMSQKQLGESTQYLRHYEDNPSCVINPWIKVLNSQIISQEERAISVSLILRLSLQLLLGKPHVVRVLYR
jgi:hypothetical protein